MSVVRLELTVADDEAYDVANRLAAEYANVARPSRYAQAVVDVRSDAEALRDRTILAAARYLKEG
jgi:hypothetical protein